MGSAFNHKEKVNVRFGDIDLLHPDGKLVVSSTSTLVGFDPVKHQSHPIPSLWTEMLEKLRGGH